MIKYAFETERKIISWQYILGHMDGNMHMGMMSMSFEAGTNVTILFKSWKTTDAWSLFGSVVSLTIGNISITPFIIKKR